MTSSEIREYANTVKQELKQTNDIEVLTIAASAGKLEMLIEIAALLADAQVSLRDRFAMAAMQSLMTSNQFAQRKDICESAYFYADAMMEERSAVPSPVQPDVDAEPSYESQVNAEAEHKARLAEPVSDPEKFVRCVDCCKEIPRPSWAKVGENSMCDECLPF